MLPDATALRETANALAIAERSGDEFALGATRFARGITLVHRDGPEREAGFALLAQAREAALRGAVHFDGCAGCRHPPRTAEGQVRRPRRRHRTCAGGLNDLFDSGGAVWSVLATTVLVEALLRRGADGDLRDAQAAIELLAAVPTDPGFVLHEIPLLRLRRWRRPAATRPLSGLCGPLSRQGDGVRFRGPHGAGRGDDMTAATSCRTWGRATGERPLFVMPAAH